MAKRQKRKEASSPQLPEGEVLRLRPVIDLAADTPQFYANHAEVNFTAFEFSLTVGRMPTRINPEQIDCGKRTGIMRVPADVQILIPPTLITGLIRALSVSKELYEKQLGVSLSEITGATTDE